MSVPKDIMLKLIEYVILVPNSVLNAKIPKLATDVMLLMCYTTIIVYLNAPLTSLTI
jgi:hypothetical protein